MKSRYTKLKYSVPKLSSLSSCDWLAFYGKTKLCCCYQKYLVSELIDSNSFFIILELLDGLLSGEDKIDTRLLTKILPDSNTLAIIKSDYRVPTKLVKLQFNYLQKRHVVYLKVGYTNITIYTKHIDHLYNYLSYND